MQSCDIPRQIVEALAGSTARGIHVDTVEVFENIEPQLKDLMYCKLGPNVAK